jgi:class 3 adenylate cyclase
MGFEDLLLIDADSGEIVYSSRKATDFGTSLKDGPYSESSLARLYAEISRTRDRGAYRLIDFERYRPAANEPTAFVASPIFDGPDMVGVLALRFPADRLESLLTGAHGWAAEGLGQTGEVFLAGADGRMRSASRFLIEDPEDFGASLKKAGQHGKVVEEVGRLETTVLALPAGSLAAERAIEGATGLMVERDYRGQAVLESYGPIDVEDLRWAIVAKRDVSDAFGMVRSYGQRFLVATVGLGVVATAVAALLGWLAARPVRRLAEAAKQLALGKTDVTLDVPGDELGELAASIGDLAKGLKSRSDESARHERALERLLRSILPRPVAERRKTGYAVVVETFPDVSLLEAEITGLDEAAGIEPERAVRLFHELVVALDEAADRRGVEKIKTVGPVYLAACGISEQRPDHASRVLDFAQDLLRAIGRFNGEKGLKLSAKVGVHVGPVVGGVVGRQKFAFDLWGEPVEVVRRLRAEAGPGMIRVSEAMRERVHDLQTFEVVDADGGERDGAEPILWVLRA